jgi:hypothetical protein
VKDIGVMVDVKDGIVVRDVENVEDVKIVEDVEIVANYQVFQCTIKLLFLHDDINYQMSFGFGENPCIIKMTCCFVGLPLYLP